MMNKKHEPVDLLKEAGTGEAKGAHVIQKGKEHPERKKLVKEASPEWYIGTIRLSHEGMIW